MRQEAITALNDMRDAKEKKKAGEKVKKAETAAKKKEQAARKKAEAEKKKEEAAEEAVAKRQKEVFEAKLLQASLTSLAREPTCDDDEWVCDACGLNYDVVEEQIKELPKGWDSKWQYCENEVKGQRGKNKPEKCGAVRCPACCTLDDGIIPLKHELQCTKKEKAAKTLQAKSAKAAKRVARSLEALQKLTIVPAAATVAVAPADNNDPLPDESAAATVAVAPADDNDLPPDEPVAVATADNNNRPLEPLTEPPPYEVTPRALLQEEQFKECRELIGKVFGYCYDYKHTVEEPLGLHVRKKNSS